MRILMVSDHYFPHVGGISVHILMLARALRRIGHEVEVLATRYPQRVLEGFSSTPADIPVHRVGHALVLRSNRSWAAVAVGVGLAREVRKVVEAGYDVVHIHGSLAPSLPLLAIRHSPVPTLITLHSYHSSSKAYRLFRWPLQRYLDRLDAVVGVSRAAVEPLKRCFRFRYRVIPNGIDPVGFSPTTLPAPGFEGGEPRLLFVGRFEPKKGLEHLLNALPTIKERFPHVLLMVVGTGPRSYSYDKHLSAAVEGNVRFCGVVDPDVVPAYFAACDVFCAPSIGSESFGIILLEAMASGRPVVASDIPGYREVVANGDDGLLVPPGDPAELAAAVIRVLTDSRLNQRLVRNGLAKAQNYSWDCVARQVAELYEELVDRRAAAEAAN